MKKIIIAEHLGFCMGVKRAIYMTEEAVLSDKKVTILKQIVHNDAIVEKFKQEGVGQSATTDSIDGGTVIIPAHGASPDIFKRAKERNLNVVDATCPLVIRIHRIIKELSENGYSIIHFGDYAHDETIGIVGHAPTRVTVFPNLEALRKLGQFEGKLALTSQTTAHVSDFAEIAKEAKFKFPQIEIFNTICNATNQRQAAVMELAPRVDLMLVVGSESSANSKRLEQIAKALCRHVYMIDSARDIDANWFTGDDKSIVIVGLSAGASTPDFLINGAIERLREVAGKKVEVTYPKKKATENRLFLEENFA